MYDLMLPFADVSVNLPLFRETRVWLAGLIHTWLVSLRLFWRGWSGTVVCLQVENEQWFMTASAIWKTERSILLKVGVHSKEQYALPNFPFKPFNPDRSIDWVWGYSFLKERPILIPELLAYYSLGCERDLSMKLPMDVR